MSGIHLALLGMNFGWELGFPGGAATNNFKESAIYVRAVRRVAV
jgi:hypothetical protein